MTIEMEEKKSQKSIRKSLSKRKTKYIMNKSEESMFNDYNLRDDSYIKRNEDCNSTRTKFAIVSDSKMNPHLK